MSQDSGIQYRAIDNLYSLFLETPSKNNLMKRLGGLLGPARSTRRRRYGVSRRKIKKGGRRRRRTRSGHAKRGRRKKRTTRKSLR